MTKASIVKNKIQVELNNHYQSTSDNYWVRGLIQSIPAVGSLIDTWFFQFAEKEKQKRIENALTTFSAKLSKLEDEINPDHIEKNIEEYSYLFEHFLRYSANEYRQKMRDAYAAMMASFSTFKYSSMQNKDTYLRKLSELNPDHLAMLKLAYDYTFKEGKSDFEKTKTVKNEVLKEFQNKGMEEAMAFAVWTDLVSKGLINESYHPLLGGGLHTDHVTSLGQQILYMIEISG